MIFIAILPLFIQIICFLPIYIENALGLREVFCGCLAPFPRSAAWICCSRSPQQLDRAPAEGPGQQGEWAEGRQLQQGPLSDLVGPLRQEPVSPFQ